MRRIRKGAAQRFKRCAALLLLHFGTAVAFASITYRRLPPTGSAVTALVPAQEQNPRNQTHKQQGADFEPRRYGLPTVQLVDKAYRHRHAPTERDQPQRRYDAAYDHKNFTERIENIRTRSRRRGRHIRFAVLLCRAAASGTKPRRVIERLPAICTIFHRFLLFCPSNYLFPAPIQAASSNGTAYSLFPVRLLPQSQLSTNCRQLRVSSLYDIPIGTRIFAFCQRFGNVGSAKPPFGSLFLPNGAHRNVFKKANGCFDHWLFPLRHHYTIRLGGMQPQAKNMRASECLRARFPRQVMPPFPQLFAGILDVRLRSLSFALCEKLQVWQYAVIATLYPIYFSAVAVVFNFNFFKFFPYHSLVI